MTIHTKNIVDPSKGLTPRSYPSAMMLPLFPDANGEREFMTKLGDIDIRVYVEGENASLATANDRKVINILSAALARQVRQGVLSRHIEVEVPELITMVEGDHAPGGEDYSRLREKLERIMATVIETSVPVEDGVRRNRRFRWVDAFEYDSTSTSITGRTKFIRVTLSQEAYSMMTGSLGYDTPESSYRSVVSNPNSTWRIYEICLATVIRNNGKSAFIPMQELHQRIPMRNMLKSFKCRSLRNAFNIINAHPQMSKHIKLTLQRRSGDVVEEIGFSERVAAKDVLIHIEPKDLSDIKTDRLISSDDREQFSEGSAM